ncbi:MAG: TonB-dependent receptor [Azonexaceae bacterium]|nr:TonB-dependent receptor [Azonexaceae bacterium]
MLKNTNPSSRKKLLAILIANLLTVGFAMAAEPVFELGTVQVSARKTLIGEVAEDQVSSLITREEMKQFNRDNVGDAVNLLSGVSIALGGMRNERAINIRGFDSRQTPLFIDGIPVYVPYDGNVDITRFTTADLAAIQVAKGFSSVSYGPNVMGGAVNLISRKPRAVLEGDASLGFGSGNERQTSVNVGSNQGLWYIQAGASYLESDYFPMSKDYQPTTREDGGHRENSYRKDQKLSLKLGLTPNASDEYTISYTRQEGEKGQPPSTYPSVSRFWQWPYWDKESLYFVSSTALGENETLKVRMYDDKFKNSLHIFSNATYTTIANPVADISAYDDETYGGSLELSSVRLANNEIKFVTHYKGDKHLATDGAGATTESFQDTLLSYAIEDNLKITPDLLLSLGLSHHSLTADRVFKSGATITVPDEKSATNGQAGLFYDLTANARLYATVAQKTRLPTLKDRFSLRFSTYIENPALAPEESINYEIGYQGSPWPGAKAEAAIFYSDISDKIQTVYRPGTTTCTGANRCQMQNVGKVRSTGFELGLRTPLASWLDVGGNFTFINMENVSSPSTKLTDVPSEKLSIYALIRPFGQLEIIPFIESESSRWASNTVKTGDHTTINLKAAYRPLKDLTLEAGVTNLTDENYALADGFPNPGRMWFANANYRF